MLDRRLRCLGLHSSSYEASHHLLLKHLFKETLFLCFRDLHLLTRLALREPYVRMVNSFNLHHDFGLLSFSVSLLPTESQVYSHTLQEMQVPFIRPC